MPPFLSVVSMSPLIVIFLESIVSLPIFPSKPFKWIASSLLPSEPMVTLSPVIVVLPLLVSKWPILVESDLIVILVSLAALEIP